MCCIFCFALIIPVRSFSQDADLIPGYYVNLRGDTIKGAFPQGPGNGFSVFKFRGNNQAVKAVSIGIDSCRELLCGKDYYKVWYGTRSMVYAEKINMNILVNVDSFKTGYIPLKLVYKGNSLNLYFFKDSRNHFFIEKNNNIEELLIAYRYAELADQLPQYSNAPTYLINPIFRSQLMNFLGNNLTRRQKNMIATCAFELFDIKRVLEKIDRKK